MKHLLLTAAFVICTMSATARAGWVSGGGELVSNSNNPWWIASDKLKEIRYCFAIDVEHFGAPLDTAKQAFSRALGFWQRQFKNADLYQPLKFPNQPFVEVNCDVDHEISVQFGKLLGKEQQELAPQLPALAGISVRTDYDERTLLGKGFIYIGAESGPLAMQTYDRLEHPWAGDDGAAALELALLHELGHTFGLQHYTNGATPMNPLVIKLMMAGSFLREDGVLVSILKYFKSLNLFNKMIEKGWYEADIADISDSKRAILESVLGVPKNAKKLFMNASELRSSSQSLELFVHPVGQSQKKLLWKGSGVIESSGSYSMADASIVTAILTEKQEVLKVDESYPWVYLFGLYIAGGADRTFRIKLESQVSDDTREVHFLSSPGNQLYLNGIATPQGELPLIDVGFDFIGLEEPQGAKASVLYRLRSTLRAFK